MKKHFDMYDSAKIPGIPVDISEEGMGQKRGKSGVRSTLQLVGVSTASMGRFDEVYIFIYISIKIKFKLYCILSIC